jgi:hypothetical protein
MKRYTQKEALRIIQRICLQEAKEGVSPLVQIIGDVLDHTWGFSRSHVNPTCNVCTGVVRKGRTG